MISSVYPSYKGAYSQETLLAFYKGNKQIAPSIKKQAGIFSIDKAKCFFSNFLRSSSLPQLISEFGILVNDVTFDMFCNACSVQLKEFCSDTNENVKDVMNATCEGLKNDASYIGNKEIRPTDYELINEVKNLCPICEKEHLTKDAKKEIII